MEFLERLGILQGPGDLGAPLNRSSNQDRREGIVIIYSTSSYLTVEILPIRCKSISCGYRNPQALNIFWDVVFHNNLKRTLWAMSSGIYYSVVKLTFENSQTNRDVLPVFLWLLCPPFQYGACFRVWLGRLTRYIYWDFHTLAFLWLAGERSEQRDQTELATPKQKNTSRRAQASPSGEKDFSSDEVGMTTSLALNFCCRYVLVWVCEIWCFFQVYLLI